MASSLSSSSKSTYTTITDYDDDELTAGTPLELPSVQLEALADACQERLIKSDLVQDRRPSKSKSKSKSNTLKSKCCTIPKCFFGEDLVSILHDLLQDQLGNEVTRKQAIQVGRDIQCQFKFFVHVKSSSSNYHKHKQDKQYGLKDTDTDLYQFHHNLPMQVYTMKKRYPSLWDQVRLLEETVSVGSHRGITKLHKDCFVAKQAVNVVMDLRLVRSRGEAVHLIRKMNEKVRCCRLVSHPGNDGSNFQDDNSLYRFIPTSERLPEENGATDAAGGRKCKDNNKPNKSMHKHKSEKLKDAAYFQERANGIRNQLDNYRQSRATTMIAASGFQTR